MDVKRLLTTCLLALMCWALQAQDKPSRELHLQLGYQGGYFKDLVFSPLNYRKNGLVFSLGYTRYAPDNQRIFYAQLDGGLSNLSTSASPFFNTAGYQADIQLGHLWRIAQPMDRMNLYLGTQYHTDMNLVFHDGIEAISFLAFHGFDLVVQADYKISDRHSLRSRLHLPAVGIFVRPPYSGWDKDIVESADNPIPVFFQGNIASWNQYQAVNWSTISRYAATDRITLSAQYRLQYQRTATPLRSNTLTNHITLGIHYQL